MIAAVLSGAVLIFYLLVEFVRPYLRRRKLKRPCDVSFIIPPQRESQPCEYAVLDDEWHSAKEITVPPHTDIHLELRLIPRLNFTESEFAFGCDGDRNLNTKPIAFEFFSSFIDKGKKVASPDDDQDHYTDRHGYYHIRRIRQRSVGQHYIVGLAVKTREVGLYNADVEVTTEEMHGIHRLRIRAEQPKTLMKCTQHRGCYIRPLPHFREQTG
jgi:hypothetical protein